MGSEQEIHMSLRGNLARVNADKDLDQFAREHGALMPIHLPVLLKFGA